MSSVHFYFLLWMIWMYAVRRPDLTFSCWAVVFSLFMRFVIKGQRQSNKAALHCTLLNSFSVRLNKLYGGWSYAFSVWGSIHYIVVGAMPAAPSVGELPVDAMWWNTDWKSIVTYIGRSILRPLCCTYCSLLINILNHYTVVTHRNMHTYPSTSLSPYM